MEFPSWLPLPLVPAGGGVLWGSPGCFVLWLWVGWVLFGVFGWLLGFSGGGACPSSPPPWGEMRMDMSLAVADLFLWVLLGGGFLQREFHSKIPASQKHSTQTGGEEGERLAAAGVGKMGTGMRNLKAVVLRLRRTDLLWPE